MSEKYNQFLDSQPVSPEKQREQHEHLANNLERKAEQAHNKPAEHIEHIRADIERVAEEAEKTQERQAAHEQQPVHHHYITKKIKKEQYQNTLKQVRGQLPKSQQKFSSFVHQPAVERISEVSAKTIARPSGILGGASFALLGSFIVLSIAHHIGFEVPNTIFIALFILGFAAGIISEVLISFISRLRPKHRKQKAFYN